MANSIASYPARGGGGWGIYPDFASFPATALEGAGAYAADTNSLYIYDSLTSAWILLAAAGVGGINSLNGLVTASQTFAVGTLGLDFNISSVASTHTFNIPDASITARGLVTTAGQSFAGLKDFTSNIRLGVASATNGELTFFNATNANTVKFQAGVTTASYTLTLPTTNADGVLQNVSGTLSFGPMTIANGGTSNNSFPDDSILYYDPVQTKVVGNAGFGYSPTGGMFVNTAQIYSAPDLASIADYYRLIGQDLLNNNFSAGGGSYNPSNPNGNTEITAIGYFALGSLIGGGGVSNKNTALGCFAGVGLQYGQNNNYFGYNSGAGNINGSQSSLMGDYTGSGVNSFGDTFFGSQAGVYGLTSTSNNVCFGIIAGKGYAQFTPQNYNATICFGTFTEPSQSNQMVVGGAFSATAHLVEAYFGGGVQDLANVVLQEDFTFRTTNGNGTDINGVNMFFKAGYGTGLSVGGYYEWFTSDPLASGTTPQTHTSKMRLFTDGQLTLGTYGVGAKTGTVAYNLAVDASGNVIESSGSGGGLFTVVTGNTTLNNSDAGTTFSNEGSGGVVELTLPTPIQGEEFTLMVTENSEFSFIIPNGAFMRHEFQDLDGGGTNNKIYGSIFGSVLKIKAINGTYYQTSSFLGKWEITP